MNILNVIETVDTETITLSLSLANAISNPIPGAWETETPPVWSSSILGISIEPAYNNFNCLVTSRQPINTPISGYVTVNANINIYDGSGYKPMENKTLIVFHPSNAIAGIVATPTNSINYIAYKKSE